MKNKTRIEYVLDTLMSGKSLLSRDIARMVSDVSGEVTKILATDRLMTKFCNTWAFQIGHFITKNKTMQGYEYSLVPEILNLTPEEIYDLTRQTGKDRFTLEMALEKVPKLGQYVKKAIKGKTEIKKPAKKAVTSQEKASAGKPKVTKGKPVLEVEPEVQEPVIQAATVEDVVAIFLNEIEKIGGLKVNVNLNVRRLKR